MATGAAIAAGPSGLRRFLGIVAVVGLLAILAVVALVMIARKAGSSGSEPFPCAPEEVNVRYSPGDAPKWAHEAVEAALEDSGRKPRTITETGERRDLMVVVWTTSEGAAPNLSGKTLRLEKRSSAQEVKSTLKSKLTPCKDAGQAREIKDAQKAEDAIDAPENPAVKWNSPIVGTGAPVALWWACGPILVRLIGKVARSRTGKAGDDQEDHQTSESLDPAPEPEPAEEEGHQK
ncbi:hypothetical protein PGC08_05795 [Brevibacterium sp. BDJS002]|uniref:hypothetical protein n=1 Tax=Brevibacterium sp. BDJS002 TaxID=3020906 RepID=UPI00230716ED|nr:hypothetical protein [Brevibacterium sp. BDJS002]WCE41195.1 hypothetical protein PGC08_05795 [Brevibacterium sp. BDJS002]